MLSRERMWVTGKGGRGKMNLGLERRSWMVMAIFQKSVPSPFSRLADRLPSTASRLQLCAATAAPASASASAAGSSLKAQRIASHLSASSSPFLAPACLGSKARCTQLRNRRGAVVALQAVEELPPRLQEIVKLFQAVPDPRAKYEQLLHYAKKLKPLGKEHLIQENKVIGCVSQVWVRPTLGEDKRISFEAESDSVLTKGLAALLVEGLSGSTALDILRVSPDFIQMLGLNQSLTPSRSNGFLNMLKLMQKKSLQLYIDAQGLGASTSAVGSREVSSAAESRRQVSSNGGVVAEVVEQKETAAPAAAFMESKAVSIRKKIQEALQPTLLELEDVSHQHAGHSGVQPGSSETHFNLKVVSKEFEGRSLVKRHRLIYDVLHEELKGGLHALSLVTKTPAEVEKA